MASGDAFQGVLLAGVVYRTRKRVAIVTLYFCTLANTMILTIECTQFFSCKPRT